MDRVEFGGGGLGFIVKLNNVMANWYGRLAYVQGSLSKMGISLDSVLEIRVEGKYIIVKIIR